MGKFGFVEMLPLTRRAGRPLTGPLKIRKLIFREPFCPPPSAREPIFKFGFIGVLMQRTFLQKSSLRPPVTSSFLVIFVI